MKIEIKDISYFLIACGILLFCIGAFLGIMKLIRIGDISSVDGEIEYVEKKKELIIA